MHIVLEILRYRLHLITDVLRDVVSGLKPHVGSGVVRIDPLRSLAGCRTKQLNQA